MTVTSTYIISRTIILITPWRTLRSPPTSWTVVMSSRALTTILSISWRFSAPLVHLPLVPLQGLGNIVCGSMSNTWTFGAAVDSVPPGPRRTQDCIGWLPWRCCWRHRWRVLWRVLSGTNLLHRFDHIMDLLPYIP